jgi:glyoxylase-like metal-dependent hydrolase (beta-lactamase superfamily II)
MEVVRNIHRIEVPLGERLIYLYLLTGGERTLLVDTGLDASPRDYVVPYLDSLDMQPEQIDYVLITHADFDHQGGNSSMRELAPNALFMCHLLDRAQIESIDRVIEERYSEFQADHGIDETDESKAWIRANNRSDVPIDIALTGGEIIRLGADWEVEALHTPGHSCGHVSLYDRRNRTAIIADATLYHCVPTKTGAPAFPPTYRYVDTYLATMHRFQGMLIDTLLTSHYAMDLRGPAVQEFLGESRAFVDRVDAVVCEALQSADTPCTTRELIDVLSPLLGEWPAASGIYLVFPLVGHLERLREHGRVTTERRGDVLVWRWKG